MEFKADIGIIGALNDEVREIIGRLENRVTESVGGIEFNLGVLYGKNVVIARCGVGKVFSAICAEAMVIKYAPKLIINSGVGGALDKSLRPLDIVFADKLVQHDMDTSPLGDPVGLISGINKVYFETDVRARMILEESAREMDINYLVGTIATGDKFISEKADKDRIVSLFGASACEMEGGAIAHTAYVNQIPFMVVRAISDSADGDACMDYAAFLPQAAKTSTALTLSLIEKY
jgi:adenosylhomocysteine nucleosidase